MLKITAQSDASDTNMRRLMGQLEERKIVVDRVIQKIQEMIAASASVDPRFTSLSLSIETLTQDPDVIRDLIFIFGDDWEKIAYGTIL